MTAIIGMTDLALGETQSMQVKDYLQTARDSADLLLRLLNDLLDFSKLESGRFVLDSVSFSLRETLAEVTKALTARARERGLRLASHVEADAPDDVVGDPIRLAQVLMNLLGNAIKFTPEGGVTVDVRLAWRRNGQVGIAFAVSDTGIGIAPEAQQRIFSPFVQADSSSTRQFGGTGLGLTIAAELVSMMAGRLEVESEPGKGSTFHFTAVFGLAPALAATATRVLVAPDVSGPVRPLELLLAEDTPANQKVVAAILKKRGHAVTVACNGIEALELFPTRPFDVVIMDVQMPSMDGLQATSEIRQREISGERLPIIAMTAHAMARDRDRCLAAGADAYIAKPVDAVRLVELVEGLARRAAGPSAGSQPPTDLSHGPAPLTDGPPEGQRAEREMRGKGLVDWSGALGRLGGDRELLDKLIEFFFEDSPSLMSDIREGLAAANPRQVERAAHSLKGLAANFGPGPVVETARGIEELARVARLTEAGAGVAALTDHLEHLCAALALYQAGKHRG
jgi:CheY-like chemotaxis protein/HPt (histidine-containing phosphotransfer) domain-containing protein